MFLKCCIYIYIYIVASELKDPICHSNECQIGSFSSYSEKSTQSTNISASLCITRYTLLIYRLVLACILSHFLLNLFNVTFYFSLVLMTHNVRHRVEIKCYFCTMNALLTLKVCMDQITCRSLLFIYINIKTMYLCCLFFGADLQVDVP